MTKHLSPGHRLFRCSLTPRLAGPASTKLLRLLVCDSQEAGKSLSHSPHGKPPVLNQRLRDTYCVLTQPAPSMRVAGALPAVTHHRSCDIRGGRK